MDRKTGKISVRHPRFVKQDQTVIATLQTNGVICVENFKDFPQMARFTLRDEGMPNNVYVFMTFRVWQDMTYKVYDVFACTM